MSAREDNETWCSSKVVWPWGVRPSLFRATSALRHSEFELDHDGELFSHRDGLGCKVEPALTSRCIRGDGHLDPQLSISGPIFDSAGSDKVVAVKAFTP